jgi:tetratricopeptide (TPR) repeat protein
MVGLVLEDFVVKKRDEIRAFITNSELRLLRVSRDPDVEPLLVRVLKSIDEEETDSVDIFTGFDHDFNDADTFFTETAEKIQQNIKEAEPEFAKNGLELKIPSAMSKDGAVETCFASYLNKVANALQEYADHFILCFSPMEIKNGSDLSSSLNVILAEIQSSIVKIIFTDNRQSPNLAVLKERREDVADMEFAFKMGDTESEIKEKLMNEDLPPEESIRLLSMLAAFALARGEHGVSIGLFYQALQEARETGDPQEQAMALFNLGNAFYRKLDYPNARGSYQGSLEISLDNKIIGLAQQNLMNIGETFLKENSPEEALLYYENARVLSQSMANKLGECQALDGKGQANRMKGDDLEAESNWAEALNIYRTIDPPLREFTKQGEAQTLERLAELCEAAGRKAQAKEYRTEAGILRPNTSSDDQESGDKK